MKLEDFLAGMVEAAHHAFHQSILASESNRKEHWDEKDDGNLHPKTTTRMIGGEPVELPEITQHDLYSLPLQRIELETETHLARGLNGKLKTQVTKGLMRRASHLKIKMRFKREEPPEGVHALNKQITEDLKDATEG